MFSVIIPLYNKTAYIRKCLQSVWDQTFKDFEIIIINDGSTDDGAEKVLTMIESRIEFVLNNQQGKVNREKHSGDIQLRTWHSEWGTVNGEYQKWRLEHTKTKVGQRFDIKIINNPAIKLINQHNSGVSIARNNGVKEAIYDYIAFLDGDDWWTPSYLEEMKNLIREFPEAGLYGSGYYLIKNGKKKVANIGVEPGFEKGIINYCKVYTNKLCMPIWTGAAVIPTNIFESGNGFSPELKLGEDFDLWVRTSVHYPVVLLNKPLAFYNQDIDIKSRAVGSRLYELSEHMIFKDYSELNTNIDFQFLFEKLALYDLLPYYLENKNTKHVNYILSKIHWEQHDFKYRLYYQIIPKFVVKVWMHFLKQISVLKRTVLVS